MPEFKVGDEVTWRPDGHPPDTSRYTKAGNVIVVVPSEASPYRIAERLDDSLYNVRPLRSGGGGTRNHESYMVAVPQKMSRGKRRPALVYWPRVKWLRPVASRLKAAP